jgi:hypothetical protein
MKHESKDRKKQKRLRKKDKWWRQGRENREGENKAIQEGNTEEDKRKIGIDSWKT